MALATTAATVRRDCAARAGNFSLCHGLAGNADVLLTGSRAAGVDFELGGQLAREVAATGISRHTDGLASDWPCGTGHGQSPSLMLGLAGIGLFYLRVCRPNVLSPLSLGLASSGRRAG